MDGSATQCSQSCTRVPDMYLLTLHSLCLLLHLRALSPSLSISGLDSPTLAHSILSDYNRLARDVPTPMSGSMPNYSQSR